MKVKLEAIKLKVETKAAVKATIKSGYFRKDDQERLKVLQKLNRTLSQIYKIDPSEVIWRPHTILYTMTGGGHFDTKRNRIELYKTEELSLVTFLHEFKHALDHARKKKITETSANNWSLAIYAQIAPKMFTKAVLEGKIFSMRGKHDTNN